MKKPYKGTRTSSWKTEDKRGGKKFGGAWKRGGDHKVDGARSTRPGMHDATCGKCGKACQVPFRPTGERPIFCSTCFANGSGPAKFAAENRPSNIFVGQPDIGGANKIETRLKAIEDKLDALIEALTEDLDDEDEDEEKEEKA